MHPTSESTLAHETERDTRFFTAVEVKEHIQVAEEKHVERIEEEKDSPHSSPSPVKDGQQVQHEFKSEEEHRKTELKEHLLQETPVALLAPAPSQVAVPSHLTTNADATDNDGLFEQR